MKLLPFTFASLEIVEPQTLTEKQKVLYTLEAQYAETRLTFNDGFYMRASNMSSAEIYENAPTLIDHYIEVNLKRAETWFFRLPKPQQKELIEKHYPNGSNDEIEDRQLIIIYYNEKTEPFNPDTK